VTDSPRYFQSAADFGSWLEEHAASETELLVGFMKVGTGVPSLTWPEAVDEALCVGWIDGIRRRVDDERYSIRFTHRKAKSNWSAVNIARVEVLQASGRMKPAGLAAFARRTEAESGTASYEQEAMPSFERADEHTFRAQPAAWAYYEAAPASYKRRVTWWVVSAKQASTRRRRLHTLIDASAGGRRL
jgi:uncharacterized protein YdeI (YjbR/CyaY-like superfamily)